jgi:hypothetical protein
MFGIRKAEPAQDKERALERLRSVLTAASVLEDADPAAVRKRLESTMYGGSCRPNIG